MKDFVCACVEYYELSKTKPEIADAMLISNADVKKLKEYKDLEEQGRLIVLPCAIGDGVYMIPSKVNYDLNVLHRKEEFNRVYHQKVDRIHLDNEHWWLECDKDREWGTGRILVDVLLGETWFLTLAEAEKALAEREK